MAGVALALCSGCVQVSRSTTEQRVVELPRNDPRSTIQACQTIRQSLIDGGLPARIRTQFPSMTMDQLNGIYISCTSTVFKEGGQGTVAFVGVRFQGPFPESKQVADTLEAATRNAVEQFFSPK
jgi:hypothetical protein